MDRAQPQDQIEAKEHLKREVDDLRTTAKTTQFKNVEDARSERRSRAQTEIRAHIPQIRPRRCSWLWAWEQTQRCPRLCFAPRRAHQTLGGDFLGTLERALLQ